MVSLHVSFLSLVTETKCSTVFLAPFPSPFLLLSLLRCPTRLKEDRLADRGLGNKHGQVQGPLFYKANDERQADKKWLQNL
jgi:hypothetical protein